MSFDIIEEDIKHFVESKAEYVQVVGKAYARLWPVIKEQIIKNPDVEFLPIELANSTGESVPDTLAFLTYLSGQRANLLCAVFFFTDDQGKEFKLKYSQISDVLNNKEFQHPETKETITEPDTKIRMLYRIQNKDD